MIWNLLLALALAHHANAGPQMIPIGGGSFFMGATSGDPAYRMTSVMHRVELSPFAISRFDVTGDEFAQFVRATGGTASQKAALATLQRTPGWQQLPATGVSWNDALAYAAWLTKETGVRYSLPSEAQWEFVARAGTETPWPWGSSWQSGRENCDKEHRRALPASALPANRFGAIGIPGNVWEWTSDCLDLDFYFHSPTRDPQSLDPACPAPMIRGGSFSDPPAYCTTNYRVNYFASGAANIGFRVVRPVVAGDAPQRASSPADPALEQLGDPSIGASLDISVDGPPSDLPLALLAGVSSATLRPGAMRTDPFVVDFLSGSLQLPLASKETRIFGIPAGKLHLYVVGPDPGMHAERTVTIPDRGTVQLRFSTAVLLGRRDYGALYGVLEDGTRPVAGATVVYSCYPDRQEARTDARGRFEIARADANRAGLLFVDAPVHVAGSPFDRLTKLVPVNARAFRASAGAPWTIDLSKPEEGA